jgi:hypothetical protein
MRGIEGSNPSLSVTSDHLTLLELFKKLKQCHNHLCVFDFKFLKIKQIAKSTSFFLEETSSYFQVTIIPG